MKSSVTTNVVHLKWTKSGFKSGIAKYVIYRNGASVGSTKGMAYNNTKVANGTYSYQVSAMDKKGNLLGQSNTISVTVYVAPKTAIADGAALYSTNCAGCHKPLASSTVMGKNADDIKAAISANLGGMGAIVLTEAQVQAIGMTLTSGFTRPECSACHTGSGSLKDDVGEGSEGTGD